jgi:D-ribulokinase
MAYVFGTSACTMASTSEPTFVPGVWGPYFSSMVPGLWLSEGGQSAAGAAIDHLVSFHPASVEAAAQAKLQGISLTAWLAGQAAARRPADLSSAALAADGLHVVPEFLGNRAPFADPEAKGLIAGLGMDTSLDSLVALYVAGLCGLGYGARQIVAAMREKGVAIDTIIVSGGAAQSEFVRQLLADATRLTVAGSASPEPVLLGSAMLGAVAAGHYPDVTAAMTAMSRIGDVYRPAGGDLGRWHDKRFAAFELLQQAGRAIRD